MLADGKEAIEYREQVAQALAGTNQAGARRSGPDTAISASAVANVDRSGPGVQRPRRRKAVAGRREWQGVRPALARQGHRLASAQAKIAQLGERLTKLTKGLPAADQRMLELIGQRRKQFASAKADPTRGLLVFEKHCAACHQIANKGAKIGPQLDGVGVRGLDRLLEDILDPNRNVDQAFRATTLVLNNGQLVTGLLLRQEGQVFVMADDKGKEVRIPGDTVQERLTAQLSPMPANLVEQIPEEDFYHLLGYLLEQRVKN